MSGEVAPAPAPASPVKAAKKKSAAKPSKKSGPSAGELILKAVATNKARSGMSYVAVRKYLANQGYDVEQNKVHVKRSVRKLVEKGDLVQVKGSGATGSFKAADKKPKKVAKKAVSSVKAKKPAAKKISAVKKSAVVKKSVAAKKSVVAKKVKAVKASPKKVKSVAAKKAAAKKPAKSPKKKKVVTPKKAPKKVGKPKSAKPAKKTTAKKPAKK